MMCIPAYQAVDIILGLDKKAKQQPRPGWYICAPDRNPLFPLGRAGMMTESADEASELAEFIDRFSKYGHCMHTAWLHDACWTPR